jgi:hypothetical protein
MPAVLDDHIGIGAFDWQCPITIAMNPQRVVVRRPIVPSLEPVHSYDRDSEKRIVQLVDPAVHDPTHAKEVVIILRMAAVGPAGGNDKMLLLDGY